MGPEHYVHMNKRLVSLLALLGINQHLSAEQRHDLMSAAYQSAPGAASRPTNQRCCACSKTACAASLRLST